MNARILWDAARRRRGVERGLDGGLIRHRGIPRRREDIGIAAAETSAAARRARNGDVAGHTEMLNGEKEREKEGQREEPRFHGAECGPHSAPRRTGAGRQAGNQNGLAATLQRWRAGIQSKFGELEKHRHGRMACAQQSRAGHSDGAKHERGCRARGTPSAKRIARGLSQIFLRGWREACLCLP